MKAQIRRGVFETNSSSTHSLQLAKQTLDEARKAVSKRIYDKYSGQEDVVFDESEFLYDNALILRGFPIKSSNEESCIYYIISNWVAKIQYLIMFLNHYMYNIDEYSLIENSYKTDKETMINLKVYKRLVELIKEYAKTKGYNLDAVVLDDIEDGVWIEDFEFNGKDIKESKITVESLENLFNTLMDDNYVLTYCDEAYAAYISPSIYIY